MQALIVLVGAIVLVPVLSSEASAQEASAVLFRAHEARLVRDRAGTLRNRPATAGASSKKRDLKFAHVQKMALRPKAAAKPANAYDEAHNSLRQLAASMGLVAGGRLEVSFIVGTSGAPEKTAVYGISPALDQALTAHLTTLRFPKEHAGLYYTNKLRIAPSPMPAATDAVPSKRLTKKRARARAARAAR